MKAGAFELKVKKGQRIITYNDGWRVDQAPGRSMSTRVSHFELEAPLEFAAADGETVVVHAEDIALYREEGLLHEARLTFTVAPDVYRLIDEREVFHLEVGARGPGALGFHPDSNVRIEARLDPALLPGLATLGTDILAAGPAFGALAAGSPLLESESWYALNVTVEVLRDADGGILREGFSTAQGAAGDDAGEFLRLPMLTIATAVLEEHGLEWHETTDDEVIRATVAGETGVWACYVVAREASDRCTVYSQVAWQTPPEVRPEMAETITRINFGLPLGNFELDFSDGEIRFKTSIDVNSERLTPDLFAALLEPNFATMDTYLPALEAVRDGRLSPEAAVQAAEG